MKVVILEFVLRGNVLLFAQFSITNSCSLKVPCKMWVREQRVGMHWDDNLLYICKYTVTTNEQKKEKQKSVISESNCCSSCRATF